MLMIQKQLLHGLPQPADRYKYSTFVQWRRPASWNNAAGIGLLPVQHLVRHIAIFLPAISVKF